MPRRKPSSSRKERADAPPSPRKGLEVVEDGVRLSRSRLWRLQREFFVSQDPREWARGRVPSYITSNAFIARAKARVVAAFLEDCAAGRLGPVDERASVHVLELGAGSGRFAYGFLRELETKLQGVAREGVSVRYVLTDLHEAPVEALRANPRFEPFVAKGLLDFAVVDAEAPGPVKLLESGDVLRPSARANPLAVVANYVFDGIPADVFEVRGGVLHESLLRLSCPKKADPEDPDTLGRFVTTWLDGPPTEAPYGDAELDTLARHLAERLTNGHFLFPVAGLRFLRHLRALGGGRLLLLASDRGHVHEEALAGLEPPPLARHGSFSIDVNFCALAQHARATGGAAFLPSHNPTHLATVALLWGCQEADRSRAHEAYVDHVEGGGPEDFWLTGEIVESGGAMDVERALAWMRMGAWDAETFLHGLPTILEAIEDMPPVIRLDVLDAARRVRDRYFPVGGDRDVPGALGDLFEALDALPEAEEALKESVALHGPTPEKLHRLAVCASALHRIPQALARLEEALALDARYEPARAMRLALQAEMRRRRA